MVHELRHELPKDLRLAIKNRTTLHTFSTIRDIVDLSNKLNKKLSLITLDFLKSLDRLDFDLIFLALKKSGYGDNFIHMIKVSYHNIQSKVKINGLLSEPFTEPFSPPSMLLYIIAAEVLANFIIANKRIKGIQIGNHEIKLVNFADDTTILLRDIDCLNRIQSILKLYEDASSSKINFTKSQALWAGDYKNKFDKPGAMVWSNVFIKIIGINVGNATLDNSLWDKISENIKKNPSLEQSQVISER